MTIDAGTAAPDFVLPASGGRTVSLSLMKGRPFVLYFYPKADTSGCTKQACAFQEALPEMGKLGVEVIGVSPDPMKLIEKFAAKYGLSFPLASDETKATSSAYGVWVEKSMYGRKYMGIERSTFLIDSKGTVRRAWHKVKIEGHADEVKIAASDL